MAAAASPPPAAPARLEGLPPPFRAVPLAPGADALAAAAARAPAAGAGTLCWSVSAERLAAAVVLEPATPLAAARPALLVAALAFVDALGLEGPPELPITLDWPGEVRVNGARAARLRLAVPPGTAEAAVPDWLAVGVAADLAAPAGFEPGRAPGRTWLAEEGFADVPAAGIVAAWARHLMAGLDDWEARGAAPLAARYRARLADAGDAGLDPATGDLRRGGAVRALRDHDATFPGDAA